jgi:predicted sugar kinase
MSDEINRIAELAVLIQAEIPRLIGEATDAINESINVALEEAQEAESDAPAKLRLAITATWNLDTNTVEVSMPVTVKRKFSRTVAMPDHNQENLPFMVAEEDGDPVSTAVRNIAQTLRKAGAKVTANVTLKAGGSNE